MNFGPNASLAERQRAVNELIQQLSRDESPIILGPWRSEVGFEALYWLPFVRTLSKRVPKFKERAVVVTRGGAALLYSEMAQRAVDLYYLRSLVQVRRENLYDHQVRNKGQTTKQLQETDWDRAIYNDVADELSLGPLFHVVHPSWMYWALGPYWEEQASLQYLTSIADYQPLAKPNLPDGCPLPPQYVAVKFYGRFTFPYPHEDTAALIQQVVATVASQIPVVMLNSSNEHDDHIDCAVRGPNITVLPQTPPEQNLALQAAVLAHAQGFVGTYGGVAQLALRLGVPSVSFYANWDGTSHAHYALSSWLSKMTNVPFVVGNFNDVEWWKRITSVPANVLAAASQPEKELEPV